MTLTQRALWYSWSRVYIVSPNQGCVYLSPPTAGRYGQGTTDIWASGDGSFALGQRWPSIPPRNWGLLIIIIRWGKQGLVVFHGAPFRRLLDGMWLDYLITGFASIQSTLNSGGLRQVLNLWWWNREDSSQRKSEHFLNICRVTLRAA